MIRWCTFLLMMACLFGMVQGGMEGRPTAGRKKAHATTRETATAARDAGGKLAVPPGARVSLHLDKERYFLGENVLVHFCVENAGTEAFGIDLGGDYRCASRHLRFSVTATDAQGKKVPDPDPSGYCLGGKGYCPTIPPGARHYESLPLLRYCRIEKPGVYKLRASHDLGWTEAGGRTIPVAEATVTFATPTAEQARGIVEEMYRLSKDTIMFSGRRQQAYADFTTLAHPVYLPILAPRAARGCYRALQALGEIPTPEATKVLVRLLDHQNPAFARKVVQTLNRRLPDPQLKGTLPCRNVFDNTCDERRRWLVSRCWRAEFAPAIRKVGRRLLVGTDTENLQCGAFIVECLGQEEDLPSLVKALDCAAIRAKDLPLAKHTNSQGIETRKGREVVVVAPEEHSYPPPRHDLQELMRAARMMGLRGVLSPAPPRSPGEMLLFAAAIGASKTFRPAGWEATYARLLRAEIPYVREAALVNLPLPPPDGLLDLVARLVEDKDVDVQIAACRVAKETKAPRLREPVLRVLASAREEWLFRAADNAAYVLASRWDRMQVLLARLDEKGMTARCLGSLASEILADQSSRSLDEGSVRSCKGVWQQFLRDHEAELKAGRSYRLADRALPLEKLFPGFTFDPPKRR